MAKVENDPADWTTQVGRIVGLRLNRGLVKTEVAVGEIVRVTPTLFMVQVKDEDRIIRFVRRRSPASSDRVRDESGYSSKKNPCRVFKDPLPED